MTAQLDLFTQAFVAPQWLYDAFVRFAREAVDAQRRRGLTPKVGAKAIVERIRWDVDIHGLGDGQWKINNNDVSRLARLVAAREPDLADVFEFRRLRSVAA